MFFKFDLFLHVFPTFILNLLLFIIETYLCRHKINLNINKHITKKEILIENCLKRWSDQYAFFKLILPQKKAIAKVGDRLVLPCVNQLGHTALMSYLLQAQHVDLDVLKAFLRCGTDICLCNKVFMFDLFRDLNIHNNIISKLIHITCIHSKQLLR